MIVKKSQKIATKKYMCELCDYNTSNKCDYNKHLITRKHSKIVNDSKNLSKVSQNICICGKSYKYDTGYYRHRKQCKSYLEKYSDNDVKNDKLVDLVLELVKQNSEFKELLVEQNKQNQSLQNQLVELSKEKTITNTNCNNNITNNNSFNLTLFLNEQCKNALNIGEFIEQLSVSLEDLEETGRLGYVEGISRIFINGLKQMNIYERPIHCSDMKREVLYIKDENKWEKDDNNKTRLTNAVRKVGQKNIRQITEWQKLHPDYNDYYSKESDKYLNIINNSMCGSTIEETNQNYSKIAKTIIKNVEIPKK
jgi:hypothetical protein